MGLWGLASATCCTAVTALALKTLCAKLRSWGVMDTPDSRKALHISCGICYLCCWPLFPAGDPVAPFLAAAVPAGMTLQFAAVGLGLLEDKELVSSVSRRNQRRELLLGPLQYGLVHVAATILGWRSSAPTVLAVACLPATADGMVFRLRPHW